MTTNLTDIEIKLLAQIQSGLGLSRRPFEEIADGVGVDVGCVLKILNDWKQRGFIRRVGAIVNHFKVGLGAGAMVVWQVGDDRVEEVGMKFASFDEVSHAYERPATKEWNYNIYTMVHGKDSQSVAAAVKKMSEETGVENYKMLETVRELKKVPPTYCYDDGSVGQAQMKEQR